MVNSEREGQLHKIFRKLAHTQQEEKKEQQQGWRWWRRKTTLSQFNIFDFALDGLSDFSFGTFHFPSTWLGSPPLPSHFFPTLSHGRRSKAFFFSSLTSRYSLIPSVTLLLHLFFLRPPPPSPPFRRQYPRSRESLKVLPSTFARCCATRNKFWENIYG